MTQQHNDEADSHNHQLDDGLLAITVYNLVVFLLFGALYLKRINKLDKLATCHNKRDRILLAKIVCIILLILLQAIHIILSFFDESYFMHHAKASYSLVDIFGIIDLLLVIYIVTREHEKKTRKSRSVVWLYILMSVQQITIIILVQILQPSVSIILPIFQVILNTILIVLTFLTQPQQNNVIYIMQSSRNQSFIANSTPDQKQPAHRYDKNSQRIFVEFNKEFDISWLDNLFQCSFKIAVYLCGNYHVINRSETQFVNLSKEMTDLFPNNDAVQLKTLSRAKTSSNILQYGEEREKVYQEYLVNLTKTDQYYAQPLMNFLQIHSQRRNILQKSKGALLKRDTINTAYQQRLKKPFFSVSWKDGKIHVCNNQILQFYVNKTNQQIIAFHNKLVTQKKLQMQLISENYDKAQLCHFIYTMANSKFFWEYFAQWMCLGSNLQHKILKYFDFWINGFQNFQMSVIGYEAHFDEKNSVVHYYLLSIQNKNSNRQLNSNLTLSGNQKQNKQVIMLKKRYSDFLKLDSHIRKYINNQNIRNAHVPSLPPKFSPFQNRTLPNTRRMYFDSYIKDIIKIDGINHCIKFLEFLEKNSDSIHEHQKKNEDERIASEIIDSHIDDMQLER